MTMMMIMMMMIGQVWGAWRLSDLEMKTATLCLRKRAAGEDDQENAHIDLG